jgi:hypothetical protein
MKIGSIMVPLVAILVPLAGATGQTLSPTNVFDASTTTPITGGATAGAHLTVQSWGIAGERGGKGPDLEIPLKGFYVAHALSGALSATTDHQPSAGRLLDRQAWGDDDGQGAWRIRHV